MVAGLLCLTACQDLFDASETPKCLSAKIRDFDNSLSCADARVLEYEFLGDRVYVFDPGTCGADFPSPVLDFSCKILGSLGGFAGNTKINGVEFSKARLVRVIWSNS